MAYSHVKCLPFVGAEYRTSKPWGVSILIVGESHYTENSQPLYAEFTTEVVQATLNGANYSFFTKAVGVFDGHWPDQETRRKFWNAAAFYNFIQETVGSRARVRPQSEMWEAGGRPLEEVLIELQPGFVLVLGKELWWNLPIPLKPGPMVRLHDGRSRESRLYFNDAGHAFTFGINHPSSRGWTYKEWTPWVKAALNEAILFQRS